MIQKVKKKWDQKNYEVRAKIFVFQYKCGLKIKVQIIKVQKHL